MTIEQAIRRIEELEEQCESEQRTGKWIYIGNGNNGLHQCNKCGAKRVMFDGLENYCPSCGAKMIEPQERSE